MTLLAVRRPFCSNTAPALPGGAGFVTTAPLLPPRPTGPERARGGPSLNMKRKVFPVRSLWAVSGCRHAATPPCCGCGARGGARGLQGASAKTRAGEGDGLLRQFCKCTYLLKNK